MKAALDWPRKAASGPLPSVMGPRPLEWARHGAVSVLVPHGPR